MFLLVVKPNFCNCYDLTDGFTFKGFVEKQFYQTEQKTLAKYIPKKKIKQRCVKR